VDAQLVAINLATNDYWIISSATRIGTPTDTTYYFTDRVSGEKFYAKEYTFRSTFVIPYGEAGTHRIGFRSRPASTSGLWMFENLSAGVDLRPVLENGKYGRLIERTINP
jgi:hypothetical protein